MNPFASILAAADDLPLPANLTLLSVVLGAAYWMFRRTIQRVDALERENAEIREESKAVEHRCEQKIAEAVAAAVLIERTRAAEVERRLEGEIKRLKLGLHRIAQSVTDATTLQAVLQLLAGIERND